MRSKKNTFSSIQNILIVLIALGGLTGFMTANNTSTKSGPGLTKSIAPVAVDDNYVVYEGTTLTVAAPGVIENDTGGSTVSLVTGPANGILQLNSDGSFSYEHNGLSTTQDSFTYELSDGVTTSTGMVTLDVLPISFGVSALQGHTLNKPTSLDFGPDSMLYVLRKLGHINMMKVVRDSANSYSVVSEEVSILPRGIPNYDDDGAFNSGEKNRQATGIVAAGTASNPILYVSTSDARVGGNGGATDTGLDTNSGVVSKISWVGSSRTDPAGYWEKIDLVRGLPRSEENHAVNGMALSVTGDTLFVTVGGFTNAGAPSNNFAYITEYALASAVVAVDLVAIDAMPTLTDAQGVMYKYDLPTLDDPTRDNVNGIYDTNDPNYDGIDIGDPWGGNDGLNQAKYIPGSPVIVHAGGFRNAYDMVITEAGRMYVTDNGANPGWGGHPLVEGPQGTCTNDYDPLEPGSGTPGPNDPQVNNMDNLHYVRELVPGEKYYAGHPTPVRGNPAGAGLYTGNHGTDGVWRDGTDINNPLPADWPPVPVTAAYPVECDFRNPGETDGALSTFGVSTNGITEYTASNFGGAYKGDLFAAGYNNNTIYYIDLNETGDQVLNNHINGIGTEVFAENFGSIALDVIAQGDNDPFPGTMWVADLDDFNIYVFEPSDYEGAVVVACEGLSNPALDEDGDGYDNEDEILNGTNACSAASKPADNDGDLTSDLIDTDDDNDGVLDVTDAFQIDADNGTTSDLPVDLPLLNEDPGTGFFGLGLFGVMTNGTDDYLNLYDFNELIPGGTAGLFTITNVSEGDATGGTNTHRNGFQMGVNVSSASGPFTVRVRTLSPFFNGLTPANDQSQGFYIGTGDQDNYLAIVLHAADGDGGIRIIHEEGGVVQSTTDYIASDILNTVNLDLFLSVDPVAGTVQPKYVRDGGTTVYIGLPISVGGDLLAAIQGTYEIQSGVSSAMAVGLISTSNGAGPVFNATWDHIEVTADPVVTIDEWMTLQAPTDPKQRHENAFVKAGNGKFYLIGGRGSRRTFEYDPVGNTWTQLTLPPIEFHHFQAVALGDTVYVVGAYVGNFPSETPVAEVYKYVPATDTWIVGGTIPAARQRGAAGAVTYNGKIYMMAGSIGGHGSEATFPLMFDEYDPATGVWTTLPDLPRGRDHFNAAVVGDKLYVLGGRAGSVGATISEVDVYDFVAGTWSTLPSPSGDVPTPRGGSTAIAMGNEVFFLGGESGAQTPAHAELEVLDTATNTWRSLDNLDQGRHGTSAVVDGSKVYIAAGAGETGGGPELASMEVFERTSLSDPGTILPSTLAATPASHDFGQVEVGFSGAQTFTLTNTAGNQNIEVTSATLTGSTDFTATPSIGLPHTLLPGESMDVDVDYAPTAAGFVSGTLEVAHDGSNGLVTIALDGEGLDGAPLSDDPIYRVNAGGSGYVDPVLDWARDTKNKPSAYINTATGDNKTNKHGAFHGVNNTGAPDKIFENSRWDPVGGEDMMWNFPVSTASVYEVRLYFREIDPNNTVIGGRIFDVSIEGETVLDNYDIYADADTAATVHVFQSYVDDGNIDIDFMHVEDVPLVHGIQISPVTAGVDMIVSADSLDFFTVNVDSVSVPQSLTLTNTSSGSLDVTSVTITGDHASDFAHTFSGTQAIASGADYSFDVTMTPTAVGSRNAQLEIVHTGGNSPLIVPVTGNGTEVHLSNLDILIVGAGSVTLSPDQPLYSDGTVVTLTATPDAGWEFDAWSGSAVGVDNPIDITIAGDMTVTATFLESSATIDPIFRVNAGGGAQSDTPIVWVRDTKNKPSEYNNADLTDHKTGKDAFTGTNLTDAPSGVYDSNRFDDEGGLELEWDFPVTVAGSYEVKLYFAETSSKNNEVGDRIFDVVVEGDLVLDDYDIVGDVGFQAAVLKQFTTVVSDGNIDIDFLTVYGDPLISAIEILPTPTTMPIAMVAKNEEAAQRGLEKPIRFYEQYNNEEWNLVGHPLQLTASLKTLAKTDVQLLGFVEEDYLALETTRKGSAYWMRSEVEGVQQYSGYQIDSLVVSLQKGWNMISGPSCNVELNLMRGSENTVQETLYRFDGAYYQTNRIEQGRGYWVYAKQAGKLELACNVGTPLVARDENIEPQAFGELILRSEEGASRSLLFGNALTDGLEKEMFFLPPNAPSASFDARFEGDSWLIEETSGRVNIISGKEALEVELVSLPENAGQEYIITAMRSNAELDIIRLKVGEIATLPEGTDAVLVQSIDDWQAELPEVFSLEGNYPNPFNPQTSIIFNLPARADVELEVFDVIGRRVMVLREEAVEAGRQRVINFDGRNLASGVYLYNVKAIMDGVTARESGKMTLVK